jgi:hypothetical protein
MHNRLKEPDRPATLTDGTMIIAFASASAQYHSVAFSREVQQCQQAVDAYSWQITGHGERARNMESGPIGCGMGGCWFARTRWAASSFWRVTGVLFIFS